MLVALVGSLLLPSNGSPQGVPSLQRYDLLLPPRGSSPVQYLLQGENGCFTWYFPSPLAYIRAAIKALCMCGPVAASLTNLDFCNFLRKHSAHHEAEWS